MAKVKVSQPPYSDAWLMVPPVSSPINLGITGMMRPRPVMSIMRVINIKPIAAVLFLLITRN
jgi:hypothetical protein